MGVRPVRFGGRGRGCCGGTMVDWGHRGAAGGGGWAGGLHSCWLFLLVGTDIVQALLSILEFEGPLLATVRAQL